ncbi:hypothetical protein PN498_05725 [Oscillatoria sp. CS-180]|uniref:hypothetical protein n=1 Tax=Oscillatoria sp. CS-180 TaxID=3021720 RepID=UPI002330C7DC|nr:hypothetical protein [Oscillatoria sp. CS-180]MDB9525478.1 hypothetical protein [Oscillatoria sp. CS-180]
MGADGQLFFENMLPRALKLSPCLALTRRPTKGGPRKRSTPCQKRLLQILVQMGWVSQVGFEHPDQWSAQTGPETQG